MGQSKLEPFVCIWFLQKCWSFWFCGVCFINNAIYENKMINAEEIVTNYCSCATPRILICIWQNFGNKCINTKSKISLYKILRIDSNFTVWLMFNFPNFELFLNFPHLRYSNSAIHQCKPRIRVHQGGEEGWVKMAKTH